MYMESEIHKWKSLMAMSIIENAALETAAINTYSVCDRMAEGLGQKTGRLRESSSMTLS